MNLTFSLNKNKVDTCMDICDVNRIEKLIFDIGYKPSEIKRGFVNCVTVVVFYAFESNWPEIAIVYI